jgi:tRNA pseudouridine32 synthase / 23S rRNA pseudouridine746 synthase
MRGREGVASASGGREVLAVDRPVDHPADLLDRVLYRDGLVLVIDKPAGIPVHAGPGGGPNLEHWFPLLRFGLPKPPALAHRLDRDTSGCLVLGRHPKALRRLGRLFAEGRVEKVYWAVVSGVPRESEGRIEAPLAKQPRGTVGWRMVVDPRGQRAVTDYRVLGAADGMAWLELRPRTGRTHQIRVHCAAIGCPVVGDAAYGGPEDHKLQLHARAIALPLYPAKPPVAVTASVPPHMRELLAALGWREDADTPARSAVA